MFRKAMFVPVLAATAIGALVIGVTRAAPANIVVDNAGDAPNASCATAGSCSLRAALALAETTPDADTITFSVAGPISVTNGALPVITQPLTITGPAASITVNGNNTITLLQFTGTTAADYTISNLILSAGLGVVNKRGGGLRFAPTAVSRLFLNNVKITNSATSGTTTVDGGGLAIEGSANQVFFTDGTVSGNKSASTGNGGGIYNEGFLRLDSVTVSGNTAGTPGVMSPDGTGGGVYLSTSGSLDLRNCTISGNSAKIGGGIASANTATSASAMRNCTIAFNSATQAGSGGGLDLQGKENAVFPGSNGAFFTSNIVSNNTVTGTTGSKNCAAGFTYTDPTGSGTNGYNLSDTSDCSFDTATDKIGDPKLELGVTTPVAADHGGLEFTLALGAGSPAIDAGNPTFSFAADERGAPTADGDESGTARRDIGAYEFGGFGVIEFTATNFPVREDAGKVVVSLRRYGDLATASSVKADATAPTPAGAGKATAADFTVTTANPSWTAGDSATKTFEVPILDDTAVEGNEIVNLALSVLNKGADFGVKAPAATITIQDWEEGLLQFKSGTGFGTLTGTAPNQTLAINRSEAGTGDTIAVERVAANGTNGEVSVTFVTGSGSASVNTDYTPVSTTLTWADGESGAKTVPVPILEDTEYEDPNPGAIGSAENCDSNDPETVPLAISAPTGNARLGTLKAATMNIADNDAPKVGSFSFDAATYSVTEGAGDLTVTVHRTGGDDCAVAVTYATSNGTATSGASADYTAIAGTTVSWAHNDSADKTFPVKINDDAVNEADETFNLALTIPTSNSTPAPTLVAPSTAVATIVSNEKLQFEFSAASYTGNEGSTAPVVVKLKTLTPAQTITGPVLVNLTTTDDTATSPADYAALSPNPTQLTFDSATSSVQTNITVAADSVQEFQEQFKVSIASPDGEAEIAGPDTVPVVIPGAQELRFAAAEFRSATESGIVTFAVKRLAGNNGTTGTVTVDYSIAPGTATAGTDYTAAGSPTGTLTWNSGDTADKFIDINVLPDRLVEGNETILLSLSNATNAVIGTPTANAIITDDDIDLVFATTTASVSEGAGAMTVTVKRLGIAAGAASVNYATSNGTAIAGTDFTAASGTLNWASGDAADKTFNVPIIDNTRNQADRTFTLTLSGASANADAGPPATATATITDDDAVTVAFSADAQAVGESAGMVTVTATRAGTTDFDITVPFTVSGTAANPADHNAAAGTITILAGDTSGTYSFLVADDTRDEANETVVFTMGTPAGGNVSAATPSTHTVTIADDDATTVKFSAATQSVSEGVGNVTVTAVRTGTTDFDISVPFTVSGTATSADHSAVNGTITIPAAVPNGTYVFRVTQDGVVEDDETVILTMGTPTGGTVTPVAPTSQTITIRNDDQPPPPSGGGGAWGLPNLLLLLGWWIRRRRLAQAV